MSRGVLYIVWGEEIAPLLSRSTASVKKLHPDLPIEIVRLTAPENPIMGLLEKARMADLSPFEETLFLDADTVALDKLDFGFVHAQKTGVACCICEAPWSHRYTGLPNDDAIEYNTGVLFFTKAAAPLFSAWKHLAGTIDSSIAFRGADGRMARMICNDQGSFAAAISAWEALPAVLPMNWNLRPIWQQGWFGPVKIWHDRSPVPPNLLHLAKYYRQTNLTVQFHTLAD